MRRAAEPVLRGAGERDRAGRRADLLEERHVRGRWCRGDVSVGAHREIVQEQRPVDALVRARLAALMVDEKADVRRAADRHRARHRRIDRRNLLEYALGSDPRSASSAPATLIAPAAPAPPRVEFTRDPARDDVTLTVESSADLRSWTTVATSTHGAPFTGPANIVETSEGARFRCVVSLPQASQNFLRIRARQ